MEFLTLSYWNVEIEDNFRLAMANLLIIYHEAY